MIEIKIAKIDNLDAIAMTDFCITIDTNRRGKIEKAIINSECFIALDDNIVVGYAMLTYNFLDNGFIDMLMVSEQHRHQGIGVEMIRYLCEICLTKKLFTSTNQSNLPMQALLSKTNFKFCGQLDELDEGDPELFYVFKK